MQISDLLHAEKSCTPAAVCPVNRNLSKFNWSPLASCSCIFIESRRGWWERKRSTLFGSKQQLPHIAHTPRVPRSKFLAQHRGRSSANLISTAQLLLQPIMLMSKERKFRCSPAAERGKERDKQGKGDFVLPKKDSRNLQLQERRISLLLRFPLVCLSRWLLASGLISCLWTGRRCLSAV